MQLCAPFPRPIRHHQQQHYNRHNLLRTGALLDESLVNVRADLTVLVDLARVVRRRVAAAVIARVLDRRRLDARVLESAVEHDPAVVRRLDEPRVRAGLREVAHGEVGLAHGGALGKAPACLEARARAVLVCDVAARVAVPLVGTGAHLVVEVVAPAELGAGAHAAAGEAVEPGEGGGGQERGRSEGDGDGGRGRLFVW